MLRPARRLPKYLRRQASSLSRAVAHASCVDPYRTDTRWESYLVRLKKRCAKLTTIVLSECKLWLIFLGIALLAGVTSVVLLSPAFNVQQMHIRRQDARIDPEEVQLVLRPLFSKRLLFITTSEVKELIASKFSDVRDITLQKEYPSTLTVTILTYPVVANLILPVATGTGVLANEGEQYAYVTSQGFVVTAALPLTKEPLPVLRITDWSVAPTAGSQLLTPDMLKTMLSTRNILRENYSLTTKEIVVFLRAQEYHIELDGVTLWFDLQSPVHLQLQRFQQFLKHTTLKSVKEYIDLRIPDRIIYK